MILEYKNTKSFLNYSNIMLIILGSKNPTKMQATEIVFKKFFPNMDVKVVGLNVDSNVSTQPIQIENVINGAINRARNSKKFVDSHKSDYLELPSFYCGIEAGLVSIPNTITGYLDYQFCAIIDNKDHLSIGSGSGWEYPSKVVKSVLADPSLEIGTIMGKISGDPNIKYKGGAIGFYSKGLLSRALITQECIQMALIPHLNQSEYFEFK
jgi:inosine/xanthosine triphosphatase